MFGRKVVWLVMTSILLSSTVVAGCSPVEKTLNLLIGGDGEQKSATSNKSVYGNQGGSNKPGVVTIQPVERPGTASNSGTGQTTSPPTSQTPQKPQAQPTQVEKIRIVLYYANKDGTGLVQESREVGKVPGMARKAVEELLKGPNTTSGLLNPIPSGTRLLDINLKPDGLAIVNLSREFKAGHKGGSTGETMTVYSLVNTLAQFPTVQRVQILLEGASVETLAGHLDLSKPLEPDYTMLKQNLP